MDSNRVLRQITYKIYQSRNIMPHSMRTNYRIERANGGFLCDLWFLTVGCVHDACGGCVMCNYGKGNGQIDQEHILSELKKIVEELPWEFEDFLLTPSGSMLDEREVSLDMREELIKILKKIQAKRFIIETRADSISDSGIDFLKRAVPMADKYIEIGLESSNDWILKHCINKNSTFQIFKDAVKKIHDNGLYVTANIGIGAPFISERAAITDAIQSIRDVLDMGVDSVVVFPYHVKKGTLLDVMYQNGMYQCVSLWALVEVLKSFSEEILQKIQISWYKDYFGEEKSYIYQSPGTCPICEKKVMKELDRYRDTQDADIIYNLAEYSCDCRRAWQEQLLRQDSHISLENVENTYRRLAEMYHIEQELLEQELAEMKKEFVRSM